MNMAHSVHTKKLATAMLTCLCVLLLGCAQTEPRRPVYEILEPTAPVELIVADDTLNESDLLQVGIVVFDSQVGVAPNSDSNAWIFAEISRKETQFLPYVLRNTLIESNQWDAVRVLPETDPSVDLLIYGSIIRSTGQLLELDIRVVDSTGRLWLNNLYMEVAAMSDFPETTRYTAGRRFDPLGFTDPFQDIFDQIANDLQAVRQIYSAAELRELQLVSELRFANDLAPDAFSHTLTTDSAGLLSVSSLLSRDDPMLNRVNEIRQRHFLFIDTVDEYYRALFDEMQPAYVLWRRYSLEQILAETTDQLQVFDASDFDNSNSYLGLIQRYDRYKWSKIYEQEFTELASGFNNEIAPAILELNQQVHGLTGTLESQYRQWRGILRELFKLETGQPQLQRL